MSILFTSLSFSLALPAAIVSLVFSGKLKGLAKGLSIFLSVLVLALCLGTLVNGLIGNALSEYVTYAGYTYFHRHPCEWVCMGLSCGSLLAAVLAVVTTFVALGMQRKSNLSKEQFNDRLTRIENQSVKAQPDSSKDYIDEIKRLKELLDMGAITQEEFDTKKAELLK